MCGKPFEVLFDGSKRVGFEIDFWHGAGVGHCTPDSGTQTTFFGHDFVGPHGSHPPEGCVSIKSFSHHIGTPGTVEYHVHFANDEGNVEFFYFCGYGLERVEVVQMSFDRW